MASPQRPLSGLRTNSRILTHTGTFGFPTSRVSTTVSSRFLASSMKYLSPVVLPAPSVPSNSIFSIKLPLLPIITKNNRFATHFCQSYHLENYLGVQNETNLPSFNKLQYYQ